MEALIHGWNTPVVITRNKTMDPLQQFVFLSPAKIKMNEELRVGEWWIEREKKMNNLNNNNE